MLESLFLMIVNSRCCVAVKFHYRASKMANNFKVDTLVKTFKDLQQEKSCLEQKLRELREQRKRIDSENETAFARLTQVKEVHAKMLEVQKVSQHKVMQTQNQVDQLEALNTKKRKTLHDWNRQIIEERERIVQERVQFEKELNDLSLIFLEAKDHYTTDSLQNQISNEVGVQHLYDIEGNNEQRQMDGLRSRLQEMLLKNSEEAMEIAKRDQRCVIKELMNEKNLLVERYQQQQAELSQMNNLHKSLQKEVETV